MSGDSPQALWDFSLRYYAVPGVAQACLALQDRHGVDVNLLMFAAWAGCCRGAALGPADFTAAAGAVQAWRDEVVQPLRAVRRRLKDTALANFHPGSAPLRARAKELELDAERLQQEHLESFLPGGAASAAPDLQRGLRNLEELLTPVLQPADPLLHDLHAALRTLHNPAQP